MANFVNLIGNSVEKWAACPEVYLAANDIAASLAVASLIVDVGDGVWPTERSSLVCDHFHAKESTAYHLKICQGQVPCTVGIQGERYSRKVISLYIYIYIYIYIYD